MIENLFLSVLALAMQSASPAPDQRSAAPPQLTSENRAAIRCSAAFAIIGARQSRTQASSGVSPDGGTSQWPELTTRGREFFVVTLASIMDEHDLDRASIEREVRVEAQRLVNAEEVEAIMPACLLMLQASGL